MLLLKVEPFQSFALFLNQLSNSRADTRNIYDNLIIRNPGILPGFFLRNNLDFLFFLLTDIQVSYNNGNISLPDFEGRK